MHDYFYGWYFRCQGKKESIAIIPAVHFSSQKKACSIQVIYPQGSFYEEFSISKFRINRKKGTMQIGKNIFSRNGIRLDCHSPGKKSVCGVLRFGEFHIPKYDIMGPFKFLSGMECRHTVYSMRHTVDGYMRWGKEEIKFQNCMGYMEGDSGISFPQKYIWAQHFLGEGSFMVSAATIPLPGIHFVGTVGFLFTGTREYRFATYLGARVE